MTENPIKKTMVKVSVMPKQKIDKSIADKMRKEAVDNMKKEASKQIGKRIFNSLKSK